MSSRKSAADKTALTTAHEPVPHVEAPSLSQLNEPRQSTLPLEPHTVLLFLIGYRILNALTVHTFFQPDEYFQALEPAWQWAFGEDTGAWITWEWKHHLRSAIHPTIFGLCYTLAGSLADLLNLDHHTRAEVLLAAPKTLQAGFAALGDFYTWRFAGHIYGQQSAAALSALLLTIVSPWQWFCSTRTFSNSLETTLTVLGLYNWPWHWALSTRSSETTATAVGHDYGVRVREKTTSRAKSVDELTRLRRSLLCAAVAVILRPTNILVWMSLSWYTFISAWRGPYKQARVFFREVSLCGTAILLSSIVLDRIFFNAWVFPPVNFLRVNVLQSLASFYGNNDWHYYMSQGYPLLLTTALPFALIGLYRSWRSGDDEFMGDGNAAGSKALWMLSRICLLVPAAFSLISHKEVRFIYPLLPALHIISASPIAAFFEPCFSKAPSSTRFRPATKRTILFFLLSLNLTISYYTTQTHGRGIITLTSHLRWEFESLYLPSSSPKNMTVGIFMPCHSTPWRSHLSYPATSTSPGIRGWALTCEPPLDLNATEKETYLDEADQFYANPSLWIKKQMSRHLPSSSSSSTKHSQPRSLHAPNPRAAGKMDTINPDLLDRERAENFWSSGKGRKPWPDYLVFFAQLEPVMQPVLRGSGYAECERFFNSHWHDDSRRVGDIIVWCLNQQRQEQWKIENSDKSSSTGSDQEWKSTVDDGGAAQKILGGAQAKKRKEGGRSDYREQREPFKRVVEKPFWKVREPEDE